MTGERLEAPRLPAGIRSSVVSKVQVDVSVVVVVKLALQSWASVVVVRLMTVVVGLLIVAVVVRLLLMVLRVVVVSVVVRVLVVLPAVVEVVTVVVRRLRPWECHVGRHRESPLRAQLVV